MPDPWSSETWQLSSGAGFYDGVVHIGLFQRPQLLRYHLYLSVKRVARSFGDRDNRQIYGLDASLILLTGTMVSHNQKSRCTVTV
jgi:hypothetical protein